MGATTVYLPEDLRQYASRSNLNLSGLLQAAIKAHQAEHDALEARFREELEKYRTDPARHAEWVDQAEEDDGPFRVCATCGTWMSETEGCMAVFEPYEAASVALLAHYPDDMRRANLQYWADSGFKDVTLGTPE